MTGKCYACRGGGVAMTRKVAGVSVGGLGCGLGCGFGCRQGEGRGLGGRRDEHWGWGAGRKRAEGCEK